MNLAYFQKSSCFLSFYMQDHQINMIYIHEKKFLKIKLFNLIIFFKYRLSKEQFLSQPKLLNAMKLISLLLENFLSH